MFVFKVKNKSPLNTLQNNVFTNNFFNEIISSYDFLAYSINHQIRENEIKYSYIINYENPKDKFTVNCDHCNATLNLLKHYDYQTNLIKCYDCRNEKSYTPTEDFKNEIVKEKINIEKEEFKLTKFTITNKGVLINYNQKYIKWPKNSEQDYNLNLNRKDAEKIGKGMTGNIFKKQIKNGEFVSIKIYDFKSKLAKNLELYKRLIERELEIQLESTLVYKSLYIVPLKYVYKEDKKIYFVNEYMNEGNLSKIIKKYHDKLMNIMEENPSEMEKIIFTIIYQITQGLLELNANFSTIHYDLKTDNILVNELGMVKLIDFGISRINKKISNDELFAVEEINNKLNKQDKENCSPYDPKNMNEERIALSKINESCFIDYQTQFHELEQLLLDKDNYSKIKPANYFSENVNDARNFELIRFITKNLSPFLKYDSNKLNYKGFKKCLEKMKLKYNCSLIKDNSLIYIQNEKKNSSLYKFDIWSLGVILYYLLVGEEDLANCLKIGINKNPKYNENFFKELKGKFSLSNELIDFLKGCLSYDVDKRFGIIEVMNSKWFKIQMKGGLDENWLYKLKGINKKNEKYENFKVREIITLKESKPNFNSMNKHPFILNGNENEINLCFNDFNDGLENLCKIDFRNLIVLNLGGNGITDASCLCDGNILSNLKVLDLGVNKISDVYFLQCHEKSPLEMLVLSNNEITDESMEIFKEIKFENLFFLDLRKNKIKDINFFSNENFPKLEYLNISDNQIENINILSDNSFPSKTLKYLSLNLNKIEDIMCLENVHFNNLERLNLSNNNINKVFEFKKEFYPRLIFLNLYQNNIKDISPLERIMLDLPCIKYIFLLQNPITNNELLKKLESISLDFNKSTTSDLIEILPNIILGV